MRPLHRWLGLALAAFLLVNAVTGLMLGWKKSIAWLQPPTAKGTSLDLAGWRPIAELKASADRALAQHVGEDVTTWELDRLDCRPDKGIMKVIYVTGSWEAQVDGASGAILSIARRNADWIERIHDGSIISDLFKLTAMNLLGAGLLVLAVTGSWLWYGPRRLNAAHRRQQQAAQRDSATRCGAGL